MKSREVHRRSADTTALACFLGYALWLSGLRTFTEAAYIAIAVPVVAILPLVVSPHPTHRGPTCDVSASDEGRDQALSRVLPWLGLLAVALVLEGCGLALGGRSQSVPTVSDVVDHALAPHIVRFFAILLWAVAGLGTALRGRFRVGGKC
jgi:hypothetical protein